MRVSSTAPDTRFTYFQAPLIVTDAKGFTFPVPSEYDFELLKTILQHRFETGTWSKEVFLERYLLHASRSVIFPGDDWRLVPGLKLTMAILICASEKRCPISVERCNGSKW